MRTTIKALDDYDSLQAGHTYSLHMMGTSRLVVLTDLVSAKLISLYGWQITDGTLRGKLVFVDGCQSIAMSCTAATAMTHHLPSGYAY